MKSLQKQLAELEAVRNEAEQFFKFQERYFEDRTEANIQRLKAQSAKVKILIAESKKH